MVRRSILAAALGAALAGGACAQTFTVTGTAIPVELLRLNYGRLPAGIGGFDLSICNSSANKQSVVSSELYQALAQADVNLRPVGRQIMLAAILKGQNRSAVTVLNVVLNSAVGVLSVLGAARSNIPAGVLAGAALGTMSAQQVFASLRPVLTADQAEKFESQVLEPALVLDGGSCVERTVFALGGTTKASPKGLSFHVR